MKIGARVETPHGIGTIKAIESYNTFERYGVGHDSTPDDLDMELYRDGVVFYFRGEISCTGLVGEINQQMSGSNPR